jgi:hypothetical protein
LPLMAYSDTRRKANFATLTSTRAA